MPKPLAMVGSAGGATMPLSGFRFFPGPGLQGAMAVLRGQGRYRGAR